MIQPATQTREYWEHKFSLTESDIEQIYNHFIEIGVPQSTGDVVQAVMQYRIAAEKNDVRRRIAGRKLYQPSMTVAVGDNVVFPMFDFASGSVTAVRDGNNPQEGEFKVARIKVKGREREFATELQGPHNANFGENGLDDLIISADPEELYGYYAPLVTPVVLEALQSHDEFIVLGGKWFVKALLAEVSIGHLHLAEAVLDMSGGGPLTTEEIVVHLDMDNSAERETQKFSLNYALLNDTRFDEVAPKNSVAWYLRRMEPEAVRVVPERLRYEPIPYDRALLSPQLKLFVRELADEWSNLKVNDAVTQSGTFSINYPHRVLGTLPLNTTLRKMLPLGRSPRQIFTLQDMDTGEKVKVWVVREGRYIYGLKDWYESNELLVGAFINFKKGDDPNTLLFGYDRRRRQSEDVRLATVSDNRIRFRLQRRRVGCGYDDLLAVGTDFTAAIDAVFKRAASRSIAQLAAALLPELASLSPQNAVHAKTLYAIMNMVKRVPPGPLFAELVRNPAFEAVGDQYWRFNTQRMRKG